MKPVFIVLIVVAVCVVLAGLLLVGGGLAMFFVMRAEPEPPRTARVDVPPEWAHEPVAPDGPHPMRPPPPDSSVVPEPRPRPQPEPIERPGGGSPTVSLSVEDVSALEALIMVTAEAGLRLDAKEDIRSFLEVSTITLRVEDIEVEDAVTLILMMTGTEITHSRRPDRIVLHR